MGDGETVIFAEDMALQKAKRMAVEQAGTYVESYTKARNFDLSVDEINTVAGGVLKVDVLDRSRSLVGNALQVFVKIRAEVSSDQMDNLVERIKGKNVANEYKRLQTQYDRLSKEFDSLKQKMAGAHSSPEREATLIQVQERTHEFRSLQKEESALFSRLISGATLFTKAINQLSDKKNERDLIESLFRRILETGHTIIIGEPQIHAALENRNVVAISVPVSVQATPEIKTLMKETAQVLGGPVYNISDRNSLGRLGKAGLALRMGNDWENVAYLQKRVSNLVFLLEAHTGTGKETCYVAPDPRMAALGISGYVAAFGIAPTELSFWDSKVQGYSLGPSGFFTSSSIPKLKDGEGFVLIFEGPFAFSIEMSVPIVRAKEITSLSGKVVEGVRRPLSDPILENVSKCGMASDR